MKSLEVGNGLENRGVFLKNRGEYKNVKKYIRRENEDFRNG